MLPILRQMVIAFGGALWVAASVLAAEPAAAVDPPAIDLQAINVLDAGGHVHFVSPRSSTTARVFVFLTGDCPISKSYVPTLNRLHDAWRSRSDVALLGIWADRTTTPRAIAAFVESYHVAFPVLLDRGGELASMFRPTHVPQAIVVDPDGRAVYRGRIDNTWPALGQRKQAPTIHDLQAAVADLTAGRTVQVPHTECVGCPYESLPEPVGEQARLTFARDIAPIVFANCVQCHRAGEVAPFPLTSYQDVAKRARMVAHVVDQRIMPPWMPAERQGEFVGQRTLTDWEIAAFRRWQAAGCPQGQPEDLPALPAFVNSGWRLGPPDLVLSMDTDFELAPDGPDVFQNFVIPIDVPEDKLVAAIDFVPGNPAIVHHALLFLDTNGIARRLDARSPDEPGYTTFGSPGFVPSGSLGGWSLGKTPMRLPGGLGRLLRQGSDMVMQIHYHPSGKPEKDRSKVAIYFAEPGGKLAADVWAASYKHDIPAGESNYHMSATYTVPQDMQLLGVVPHMHLIGRSVKVVAKLPDGTQRPIINIPQWNFNWQDDYRFAQPFHIPQGTQLEVEAVYDNTENNPFNPSSPPRRVRWGEQTTDEMLYCFFLISVDDADSLKPILAEMFRREALSTKAARLRSVLGGRL